MAKEIEKLTSILQIKFPLFICPNLSYSDSYRLETQDYITVLHTPECAYLVDIKDPEIDYISYLTKLKIFDQYCKKNPKYQPLPIRLTFNSLAHLIWGKPEGIRKNAILIDDRAQVYYKSSNVTAEKRIARFVRRIHNYIMVAGYPNPIQIPNNPSVFDVLDTYEPKISLLEICNTWFFYSIEEPMTHVKHRKTTHSIL